MSREGAKDMRCEAVTVVRLLGHYSVFATQRGTEGVQDPFTSNGAVFTLPPRTSSRYTVEAKLGLDDPGWTEVQSEVSSGAEAVF